MNTPAISELFTLPDGKKNKVEYQDDSKAKHAGIFTFYLQDHTVGNLLRYTLLRDENVKFAGYRRPHPLENKIEMKVHTTGKIDPKEAVKQAFDNLSIEVSSLKEEFLSKIKQFNG